MRMHFTNGQSNGKNLQNLIDNIQVNGMVVPEPATVAGGLLGVLALCWFQRRRLIGACVCGARKRESFAGEHTRLACWFRARPRRIANLSLRQPVCSDV